MALRHWGHGGGGSDLQILLKNLQCARFWPVPGLGALGEEGSLADLSSQEP